MSKERQVFYKIYLSYFNISNGSNKEMVDLLKPEVGNRTKHKIYKDSREEEDKALEFQNIDSLECKDAGEALDMYNHAFRNQLLYNEDLQKAKSPSKDHAVFAINIDYTDTIKNKHF